jgi:Zn-dependent peptidase ImmA (M78 family)
MTRGTAPVFAFDLQWDDRHDDRPRGETCTDATWGRLSFGIDGKPFWGQRAENGPAGIHWAWIDLLEHLAGIWPWLENEDGWPSGLSPQAPRDFESAVRDRLADMSALRGLEEEQRFFEFRARHDLSWSLQGAIAPCLWAVREGLLMWLGTGTREVELPAATALEVLGDLGDAIARRIEALDLDERLAIATGLTPEQNAELAGGDALSWFEVDAGGPFEPGEIAAAARMTTGARVPRAVIRTVLEWIKGVPARPTPDLDRLSDSVPAPDRSRELTPAQRGYDLASWLRTEILRLTPDARGDPSTLLGGWGVRVADTHLGTDAIDAVAAWGRRHGPAVLVNTGGKHASSIRGRRATLAHEIAHLLADRRGSLPLADVVGGHVPETVEKRARAFAAELLAPRQVVGEILAASGNPSATLAKLCERYEASEELVAWQARNSGVPLPESVMELLRGKVRPGKRERF